MAIFNYYKRNIHTTKNEKIAKAQEEENRKKQKKSTRI